jgi:methylamine dehydrogenase heavy chain
MTRILSLAVAIGLMGALAPSSSAEPEPEKRVDTLASIGDHFVWVPDRLLEHSLMFDGDSGEVMASIDSNNSLTPKPPLRAKSRNEIYSVDIDYSRGRRGVRTDYVTIYDAATLLVVGEIVLPHPTAESNASIAHTALLDGDRFLLAFSQFPNTVVTVVDLESRSIAGEVPIAGCAGVYPVAAMRFATLCGNGSTILIDLAPDGSFEKLTRSEPFFDVVEDPVAMAGSWTGSSWIFVSFAGLVHEVDFSGAVPLPQPPWPLASESERDDGWRPGGLQHVAFHRATKRLYVVMHQGGAGTHKDPGPEIWGYDLDAKNRTQRIETPNLTADFLGPLLGLEAGSLVDRMLHWVTSSPGVHAIVITQDDDPVLFARNAELGVVAVLDPETGEHLRSLEEAGLTGPTLGVP